MRQLLFGVEERIQRRPVFLIVLILVVLGPILAACGGSEEKEFSLAPESALPQFVRNVIFPVMVTSTTAIAWAILAGTALNFIGLGVQPPIAEWGADMADGRNYLRSAWWITGGPGLAVMLTIFAVNLLGDWLASSLDPRLRRKD